MKRILKFQIPMSFGPIPLMIPAQSKILEIADQYGNMEMWVEAETYMPMELVDLYMCKTGDFVPEDYVHVKTVLFSAGRLVLHLYKRSP